jgi:hypothetical protein
LAQDMTQFDAALKEDFLPGIRKIFSEKALLDSYAQKNTEDVEGQYARLAIHAGPSGGIGSRGAVGATLPTAGQQKLAEQQVKMRYHYGRIKVEEPVIQASKTNKGAVVRALATEIKGMAPNLKRDLNRQRYGTSDGVIAETALSSNSTTINLASTTTATQMRHFAINMIVDVGTVASPTGVASARTVTAVSRSGKTITVSGAAVTTATTDRVFRSGNGGDGTSQKEITGLRTMIDSTGSLFGIDPATVPDWASVEDSTGGVPTEDKFRAALDDIEIYSGATADFGVTDHATHRAYANQLTAAKTFVNTMDMKGGYKGLSIMGPSGEVALAADRDCPEGFAFFLTSDHLIDFVQADLEWAERDGSVLKPVSGEPAWEAWCYRYNEAATDNRGAHAVLSGLTS